MFVTTHAVVASTIAIKTGNPYIYIPFAALDHFLLDMMPHFGGKIVGNNFKIFTALDAVCGITLFLILARYTEFSVLILFAVCFLAGWPDLVHLYQRVIDPKKMEKFQKFHCGIQKFEFPAGILIEIVIVAGCLALIFV